MKLNVFCSVHESHAVWRINRRSHPKHRPQREQLEKDQVEAQQVTGDVLSFRAGRLDAGKILFLQLRVEIFPHVILFNLANNTCHLFPACFCLSSFILCLLCKHQSLFQGEVFPVALTCRSAVFSQPRVTNCKTWRKYSTQNQDYFFLRTVSRKKVT